MVPLSISPTTQVLADQAFNINGWLEWSKESTSKAATILGRGAYSQYVSTATGRLAYAKLLRQA